MRRVQRCPWRGLAGPSSPALAPPRLLARQRTVARVPRALAWPGRAGSPWRYTIFAIILPLFSFPTRNCWQCPDRGVVALRGAAVPRCRGAPYSARSALSAPSTSHPLWAGRGHVGATRPGRHPACTRARCTRAVYKPRLGRRPPHSTCSSTAPQPHPHQQHGPLQQGEPSTATPPYPESFLEPSRHIAWS